MLSEEGYRTPFRPSLLADDVDGEGALSLFPDIEPFWFETAAFYLLYSLHGGSGLHGLTLERIEEMNIKEIQWWIQKLNDKREAEAKALNSR